MSMTADRLLRDDLRGFGGYRSARSDRLEGDAWLNANESPWPNPIDATGALRRYPEPQPTGLGAALAMLYGVAPTQLLVGRGSDEGIDLLLRAFCMPGRGAVVVAPPVFGMYAVCARLQGATVVEVPLEDGEAGLCVDLDAIGDAALDAGASLVFLCSPGNPSGEAIDPVQVAVLARRLEGRSLVVVDEAYAEFSDRPSALGVLDSHDNLVVLRTLSKAHALAGARVGCVIAAAELIAALRCCQAPYPVPQPCADLAVAALAPEVLRRTRDGARQVRGERARLAAALPGVSGVRRVYPSQGNFLLVRFADADSAFARLLAAGVVVRDMRALPRLGDALRISIGSPAQNDRVLRALSGEAA